MRQRWLDDSNPFGIFPAGAAFLAAAGKFIHSGPSPRFRSFHTGAALFVAGFNMGRLALLLVGVAGFIALGHGVGLS